MQNQGRVTLASIYLQRWLTEQSGQDNKHHHDATGHLFQKPRPTSFPPMIIRYIGLYGLTPDRLLTFLKSVQGKLIITLMSEKIAQQYCINDNVHQQLLDKKIKKHRKLMALFLGLIYKKRAKKKRACLKISSSPAYYRGIKLKANAYHSSIQALNELLTEKQHALTQLACRESPSEIRHIADIKRGIVYISNQIDSLQSAYSLLLGMIRQVEEGVMPQPVPVSKTEQSNRGISSLFKTYKHVLFLIKNKPTQDSIKWLEQIFSGEDGRLEIRTKTILGRIQADRAMPKDVIHFLLNNIERIGLASEYSYTHRLSELENQPIPPHLMG